MQAIHKIALVALDDRGRLLVVRKRGGRTFILPGGKPEENETDLGCLERELEEELGVLMHVDVRPLGAFPGPAADMEGQRVLVKAYRGGFDGEPSPRQEIEEMRWIDIEAPDIPIADTISKGVIPALRRDAP